MEPFIGEIRVFGFTYAPSGWRECNGDLLSIRRYPELFSVLGTFYGGDGRATFALPDLRGRSPLGAGAGPGLSERHLGERGGAATVTLHGEELATHPHPSSVSATLAIGNEAPNEAWASASETYQGDAAATESVRLAPIATGELIPEGECAPHNNLMPYLALQFCIATEGMFPSRP